MSASSQSLVHQSPVRSAQKVFPHSSLRSFTVQSILYANFH